MACNEKFDYGILFVLSKYNAVLNIPKHFQEQAKALQAPKGAMPSYEEDIHSPVEVLDISCGGSTL